MTHRLTLLAIPALVAGCVTGDPTEPGRATTREQGTTDATQILDEEGVPAWLVACSRSQANCVSRSAQICGTPARVLAAETIPGGTTFVRSGFGFGGHGRRGFRGGFGVNFVPVVIPDRFNLIARCPENSSATLRAPSNDATLQATSQ